MNKLKKIVNIENYIIFYMILMVFSSLAFIPDAVISVFNMFFYATSFILLYIIIKKDYQVNRNIPFILKAILLFLISYIISIALNGGDVFGNIKSLSITIIQLVVIFYYTYRLNADKRRSFIKRALKIYNILLFVITLIALLFYLMGIVVKYGYMRYNGLFSSPNNASLCVIAAFISLLFLIYSKRRKEKIFYFISIMIQVLFIPLTVSRGAIMLYYIVFILGFMVFVFQSSLKKFKAVLLCVLFAIITVIGCSAIEKYMPYLNGVISISSSEGKDISSKPVNTPDGREDMGDSNSIRMNMLIAGFHSFKNHPFLGVTSRNLAIVVKTENPNLYLKGVEGAGLHNTYMQVLVSNGIIGFICVSIIILISLYEGFKNLKHHKFKFYLLALLIGLFVYMNISVTLFYFSNVIGILFWLILGCFAGKEKTILTDYQELEDEEIRKIQIDVLDEVTKFCHEHALKYSLFYGTMIGAIRHKGYIPWDDDIDIAMPREDYEYLMNNFHSDHVEVVDFERNKNFWYTYGKAYMMNTLLIENANVNSQFELGVNIDIFAFDPVLSEDKKKKQSILYKMYTIKMIKISSKRNPLKNIVLLCMKFAILPFSQRWIIKRMINNGKSGNCHVSDQIGLMTEGSQLNYSMSESDFTNNSMKIFEDKEYLVCNNYDKILTTFYGDYMKCPPESEQVTHHSFKAYIRKF